MQIACNCPKIMRNCAIIKQQLCQIVQYFCASCAGIVINCALSTGVAAIVPQDLCAYVRILAIKAQFMDTSCTTSGQLVKLRKIGKLLHNCAQSLQSWWTSVHNCCTIALIVAHLCRINAQLRKYCAIRGDCCTCRRPHH